MSIQIFDNTLLKILIRQGTDNERKNITLNSGELGYTTDTKRLYIGDGSTPGGNIAGNLFKGSYNDITTATGAITGDLVYSTKTNILYRLKTTDGSKLSCWEAIGGKGIDSTPTNDGNLGSTISNLVSCNKTNWRTLSDSRDSNTFYIVSDTNYLILP